MVSKGVKLRDSISGRYGIGRRTKLNLCRRVERLKYRINQVRFCHLRKALREPDYWKSCGRRIGGVNLFLAFMWNCGNRSISCKEKGASVNRRKAEVSMEVTGTDQLVVVAKRCNGRGAKGLGGLTEFYVQLESGGNI